MKTLCVITDNLYYYYGVKRALEKFTQEVRFGVCRLGVSEFIKNFKNEILNPSYFLAGPDSNDMLYGLCGFYSFRLIEERKKIKDFSIMRNLFKDIYLPERFLIRRTHQTKLTNTEFDTLILFMKGCDNKTIAQEKDCTVKAVSALKIKLRKKLLCHSDMELMRFVALFNTGGAEKTLRHIFVSSKIDN